MQCQFRPTDLMPPPGRRPYYIVAPAYTRLSAGIKAMHLLCHSLNLLGHNAFVLIMGNPQPGEPPVNPELLTPIITGEIVVRHFSAKRTPIVVYPEIVAGNPLNAPVVARYVLNFPGLLGGTARYHDSEIPFGFSKVLAAATGYPDQVLRMPVCDINVFHPPGPGTVRSGTYFYARKFRMAGGVLSDLTKDSTEITYAQTPQELGEIFRRAECVYCYENTAIGLEATLCGCPAIFIRNQHLTQMISDEEFQFGMAWSDQPEEVERARVSAGQAFDHYLSTFDVYARHLEHFIDVTQERAKQTPYKIIIHANE